MAGDWIAMRVDLADDPAVIQIAAMLGMETFAVVGRLLRVWSWVGSQTTDGNVSVTLGALQMKRSCNASETLLKHIDVSVSAQGFACAMVSAGWLVVTDTGITFPKFDRWNSQTAKQRLLASRRVKRCRDRKAQRECNGASVTKPLTTEQDSTDTSVLRTEGRGSRRKAPKDATAQVLIPDQLAAPVFLAAWEAWLAFRREDRHTVKPAYLAGRLAELEPLGPDLAAQCLAYSTSNRYQGLFPERFVKRPNQDQKPNSDAAVMRQIIEGMQHP
jgi:hypothetical protein